MNVREVCEFEHLDLTLNIGIRDWDSLDSGFAFFFCITITSALYFG